VTLLESGTTLGKSWFDGLERRWDVASGVNAAGGSFVLDALLLSD